MATNIRNKNAINNTINEKALQIVMNVLKLGAYLHRTGDRLTEEFGINQQQFVVLFEILEKKEANQKQLVGELLFEKSNVSKIIKKLKSMGLIEVKRDSQDARITKLKATDKGIKAALGCSMKFNDWNTEWTKPLSQKEIKDTIRVFDRLSELPFPS